MTFHTDQSLISPTYRGLSTVSRRSLDDADKPRHVGVVEQMSTAPSIIRAHQHSTGAASEENQATGKSVGGNTTKIHMAVDAYVLPMEFDLTGGEVHDSKAAPELIARLPFADYTIADKGYDSEEIRELIRKVGSIPIIPRKRNSKTGNGDIDWCLYKYRVC